MKRIALICSEPIRAHMAGIGVRYLEFARRLPAFDVQPVLFTAGEPADVPALPNAAAVRPFREQSLPDDLADCDAAVVQGGLGDLVARQVGDLPMAVDLYDPWMIENLHYYDELGSAPYRRDHASWSLQLSRGDYFLCSSERQRCFYLGWLAAVGRLSPQLMRSDPTLATLIGVVPFGIPEELPEHRPLLPAPAAGERRILFGGLYDWLDPWPVLEALDRLDRPYWTLILVRNPNPETTPQRVWRQVESWCRERGWWENRVRAIDWVAADRRFDLFRDVDALVISHRDGPETWLSLRTRALDAVAAGCPVVVSDGGETAELLRRYGVGIVVAPGDAAAMAAALRNVLERGSGPATPHEATHELVEHMSWQRVLQPLARFVRNPWRHSTRQAVQAPTVGDRLRTIARAVGSSMRTPAGPRG
jgi:glycosyltransferase involved in cell wall biosynthesis